MGNLNVVYIGDSDGEFTKGKYYKVINTEKRNWGNAEKILIENDKGQLWWKEKNPYGIIQFGFVWNKWVQFIGDDYDGLTKGKIYRLCVKQTDEHYYFMNDYNKFVGIYKINYFGGAKMFIERDEDYIKSLERNCAINSLLKEA